MGFAAQSILELVGRQAPPQPGDALTPADELLKLLQNPFAQQLQVGSIWAALGTSFAITGGIALLFSFLRPYNTVVYAPKLKHADDKHAPPVLGKGIFAWIAPLWKTNEADLTRLVGMDATIFMRFTLMCRNLFVVLAVIGCGILIPVHNSKSVRFQGDDASWLALLTPANVWGEAHWAQVVVAWTFDITIVGFLWWNYRKVLQLRRKYFESPEYQQSLHARTLMMYDIPKKMTSDEGIARIIDSVAPNSSFSRTAVARNVKILPQLISEHEKTVRKLEKVLAKYLKDPHNLPAARPVCKPSKKDRSYETYAAGQKVDAIEYLTQRIKELEIEIKEVRLSVDKRNAMPYGFASYADISEAHSIAYAARKKKPEGAVLRLAPRPNDIIWDNMPLSAATRSRKRFINNLWVALLTLVWVAPNAMMAIFLVNLSNLGLVWPAFQQSLQSSSGFWQVVQGVAAPALTAGIYLLLPIIFRRLSIKSGDQTKTGRERHVVGKLYAFFIFNNLVIFSLFSACWGFVAGVVKRTEVDKLDPWEAIIKQKPGDTLLVSLCNISPFFVTYILQRQLGTAIDLAQLWPLIWGFLNRKFSSPTPRELIELTAPPPFDYAIYYNYFLYYATVALTFASIQPLILPAAAIYFAIDVPLRKYLLMYIFVTKTESGGLFWRVLFNRLIFATILSNVVTFLVVFIRGNGDHFQAYAVAPLPFLMIGFKIYCSRTFDDKIHYYTTRNVLGSHPETGTGIANKEDLRSDRLAARFGHPAIYKPLITPMVHAKAQNILASVYSGRLTHGREAGSGDSASVSGYSDVYALGPMDAGKPGKVAGSGVSMPGFEVVPESKLDFEYYKNRAEFTEEHGGGEMYGRPATPSTMFGPDSRSGSPAPGGTAPSRRQFSSQLGPLPSPDAGTAYQPGYNLPASQSPPLNSPYQSHNSPYSRAASPKPFSNIDPPIRTRSPMGMYGMGASANDSGSNLVGNAAAMPIATPLPRTPGQSSSGPMSRDQSLDRTGTPRAPGMLGGGPYGYGNLPQEEHEQQDPMSYDYFRSGRRNTSGWSGGGGGSGAPGRG